MNAVWKDLQVIVIKTRRGNGGGGDDGNNTDDASNGSNFQPAREFLTAMAIAPGSKFAGKTAAEAGINKLPDLFLVSIDRPVLDFAGASVAQHRQLRQRRPLKGRFVSVFRRGVADTPPTSDGQSSVRTENITFTAVAPHPIAKDLKCKRIAFCTIFALPPLELTHLATCLMFQSSFTSVLATTEVGA